MPVANHASQRAVFGRTTSIVYVDRTLGTPRARGFAAGAGLFGMKWDWVSVRNRLRVIRLGYDYRRPGNPHVSRSVASGVSLMVVPLEVF